MKLNTLLALLATSSLVLAQPASAAQPGFEGQARESIERLGSSVSNEEDLRGRATRSLWVIMVTFVITVLVVVLVTSDNGEPPISP